MLTGMTRVTHVALGAWLVAAVAWPAAASEMRAAVGKVQADGSVSLYLERFHEELPDGSRISEIRVRTVDNHLQLTRKARLNGGCHVEAAALIDQAGQPVLAGSLSPGQELLIGGNDIKVKIVKCGDDGCVRSKYVVPLGEPPLESAHCDISELTGNECGCLQFDGTTHHVVPNGLFCKSAIKIEPLQMGDWMHLGYLETF